MRKPLRAMPLMSKADTFSHKIQSPSCVTILCILTVTIAYFSLSNARPLSSVEPSATSGSSTGISVGDAEDVDWKKLDDDVRLVRLKVSTDKVLDPRQDKRGWMLDPIKAATDAGLTGGSRDCTQVHIGEIRAGNMRGNHRHRYCNETIILWGAKQRIRNEDPNLKNGYAETVLDRGDVAVLAGPQGHAHAITNLDETETVYLVACQDALFDSNNPLTDYKVWPDL
eukprot:TRINITY_DN16093_c0_g1_i1.p1 TRINITY_DN16093_c0_g1~~TRINITY_DN16093_c0_g1_i1.p1  ORF type:complete len:226 (+),score=12.33 TRINITY_DN16093_c0_g1_i1:184-861(+)